MGFDPGRAGAFRPAHPAAQPAVSDSGTSTTVVVKRRTAWTLPCKGARLLEGPLDAAGELAMSLFPQSPNLFWPDDRAWCVATEIDLDSTYFGGTAALVAEVLADERLEAVPVEVTDPVWADSDDVNR